MNTEGMIRSPWKIEAIVGSARSFQQIRAEYGSFDKWLWKFSEGKTICYMGKNCPCYQHIIDNYPTVRKRRLPQQ